MILVFLSYPICLFSVIFLKLLITWTLNKLEFFSISLEGLSYQELTVRNRQYKKPSLAQETMLTLVKCSLKLQSLQDTLFQNHAESFPCKCVINSQRKDWCSLKVLFTPTVIWLSVSQFFKVHSQLSVNLHLFKISLCSYKTTGPNIYQRRMTCVVSYLMSAYLLHSAWLDSPSFLQCSVNLVLYCLQSWLSSPC